MNRYDYCYNNPVIYHDDGGYVPVNISNNDGKKKTFEEQVAIQNANRRETKSKEAREVSNTNNSTASNNSNLVENPYAGIYGPEYVTEEVLACLIDAHEGKNVDATNLSRNELSELIDILIEAIDYHDINRLITCDYDDMVNSVNLYSDFNYLANDLEIMIENLPHTESSLAARFFISQLQGDDYEANNASFNTIDTISFSDDIISTGRLFGFQDIDMLGGGIVNLSSEIVYTGPDSSPLTTRNIEEIHIVAYVPSMGNVDSEVQSVNGIMIVPTILVNNEEIDRSSQQYNYTFISSVPLLAIDQRHYDNIGINANAGDIIEVEFTYITSVDGSDYYYPIGNGGTFDITHEYTLR